MLAVRPPCLAARDALGSEGERHFGGLTAANGHVLGLRGDLAVANDVGLQAIHELRAAVQSRRDERAAFRGGTGHVAVNRQTSAGGQGHHDGGRGCFGNFLFLAFLLRHRLLFRSGSAAAASGRASGRVATMAMAAEPAEQTTVTSVVASTLATMASNVATTVATTVASDCVAAIAAAAVAAETAEQTTTVATMARTRAGRHGMAAVRTSAPIATAEVNRLGAAAQGHHENNAVHFKNLQQQKEPTQSRTIVKPMRPEA